MVSECTVKRLGDLPFFSTGSCGTFIIDSLMTILLCFSWSNDKRGCQSLTHRSNGPLSNVNNFVFDDEFDLNAFVIPDSKHDHWKSSIANYQGFPLVLGGSNNNKLEMLDTRKSPPEWVEFVGTDYPFGNE